MSDPRNEITSNREAAGNLRAFAESGRISVDSNWITVQLDSYYFHPAIIAGTPSFNGNNPASVRIRNLRHGHGCAGWCFDIRVQEAPCMDDVHVEETIRFDQSLVKFCFAVLVDLILVLCGGQLHGCRERFVVQ